MGLGLNVGAYLGEIFRAGVVAVPKGHREASAALAMSPAQTLVWVVAPVALRAIFPAFSNMFAQASSLSEVYMISMTYSGSATGTRYGASANSVIHTNGAGGSYFPGNAAGSVSTGGQYI